MNNYTGQRYLFTIDELDLDDYRMRRIAIYCLEEFYGAVMADVGRELLNLRNELKSRNLRTQWDRIESRLESLDEYDREHDYNSIIEQLKAFRDKVAHDYDWKPPQDNIEYLREVGPEWREWLVTISERYNNVQRELDARETLIQLTEEAISDIFGTSVPSRQPFKDEVEGAKQDCELLQTDLARIRTETSEITPELVRLFSDTKELMQVVQQSKDNEIAVDRHIDRRVDEAIEEAAFQRMSNE